jgi:hypothetical protein
LKLRKVCARWVPRELKNWEQNDRMGLSLQHLLRYADEGEDMLTGDESWVHQYQLESVHASMQWEHPTSPSRQPKSLRLRVRHQLERLCLPCCGILREYC